MRRALPVLALAIILAGQGCSPETRRTEIRAAFVPSGYYLPFLIVEDQDLLAQYGYSFKLARFNSNSDMINAFLNDQLDVTAQSSLTMFPVELQYPGLFKFVYGQYNEGYSFVVPAGSPLSSLTDLNGKSILTWQSPTAEACIKLLLKDAKGNPPFRLTRVGAGDIASQMERGSYDAAFLFDVPGEYLVATKRFRYLSRSSMKNLLGATPLFNGGAFVSSRLITQDPRKAKAIREALLQAVDLTIRDPAKARAILAKNLRVDAAVASSAPLDLFRRPDGNTISSAEKTFDLLRNSGLIDAKAQVDVQKLFWLPSS